MIETEMITEVMGGSTIVGSILDSTAELREAIAEGLPKSTLRHTAMHVFGNTPEQTQFVYRVVPEATFKRRKGRLTEAESERTERIARTVATAEYVLGDKDTARQFLINPHGMLNGKTPIETALSELGARQVEQILFGAFFGLPV